MRLFAIVVPTLMLLFTFWGVWTLPLKKLSRFLLFLFLGFGFLYAIPLGPVFRAGGDLPLWLAQCCGTVTAITITFVSILFLRFIFLLLVLLYGFIKSILRYLGIRKHGISFKNSSYSWKSLGRTLFSSKKLSTFILFFGVIFGVYGAYEAMRVPRVIYHDIAIKNLPESLEGYTIVQISDTHLGVIFREEWMQAVVDKIKNIENVNLIVHTGDMADADVVDIRDMLEPLKELRAPDGVHFAFGNHENYHVYADFKRYYEVNNFHFMEDGAIILENSPIELSIAYAAGRATPTDFEKIFKGVTKKEAHEKGLFRLHLDHYPARAHEAAEFVDLQLSGHTHGGLTFFIAPIIKNANRGFVNGLYDVKAPEVSDRVEQQSDMILYVSSTTGLWSYACIRLLNPSEIAVLRLVGS